MKAEINFKLMEARRKTGCTQAKFAASIGMLKSIYGDIERNRLIPTEKEMLLIADGLHMTIDKLFKK